jgi:hypothetical protein
MIYETPESIHKFEPAGEKGHRTQKPRGWLMVPLVELSHVSSVGDGRPEEQRS